MSVSLNPLVKWAQDRNLLYLTVEITSCVINKLEIGNNNLKFQGEVVHAFTRTWYCRTLPGHVAGLNDRNLRF